MPEDVKHPLAAFTPVGLDRDAVLFAAGKATARRWAGWKWLTFGLLATNTVTLAVLFWPKPAVNPSRPVVAPIPTVEPSEPLTPDPSSYIALRNSWDEWPAVEAGEAPALPAKPLTPRSILDLRMP